MDTVDLDQIKTLLRAGSGNGTVRAEPWVRAVYGPSGLFDLLLMNGKFVGTATRHASPPAHQQCHAAASAFAQAGRGDWWLGFGFGHVGEVPCWFIHSWLSSPGSDAVIELTTSRPQMYFGVRDFELTPALQEALAQDPPTSQEE